MGARFTRSVLIQKIQTIAHRREDITLSNLDAEVFLEEYLHQLPERTLIYFDPPYYVQGGDLYLNSYSHDSHVQLSETIQQIEGVHWILSYDAADAILDIYDDRRKFVYDLQYHATDRYKGREVFIFSDEVNLPDRSVLPYIDVCLAEFE